jgi:hypothetical protein
LSAVDRNLRWMAWAGVAAIVIILLGQGAIAHYVPPPGPQDSRAQILNLYVEHHDRIRIGLIVATFGAALLGPWVTAIAIQMKRIEGRLAPLAWLQVMLGACLIIEFLIPITIWQAAAFRPEDDPNLTYRLHDLASIMYVALPVTGALQTFILGIAILQHEQRIFPRWLAYLSFWAGIGFLPGALNPLAHDGPVAWDGILAWWLGLGIFGVWIAGVTWSLLKAPPIDNVVEEHAYSSNGS